MTLQSFTGRAVSFVRRRVLGAPAKTRVKAAREAVPIAEAASREARKAARIAEKQKADEARAQRKAALAARLEAEQRAAEDLERRAYANYLQVREWAAAVRSRLGAAADTPEDADARVAASLAHLWDASPETITNLRRACEPVTGVRAADYEPPSDDLELRLRQELMVLRARFGMELYVDEPQRLGGFGVRRNGLHFNEDNLRWFGVFASLHDGGVLGQFRGSAVRHLVWEIGGGWGGFAYRFKTLCPNVTYLVTGRLETLLLSATYLTTMFPDARCRFLGTTPAADLWSNWQGVDFVFVEERELSAAPPPHVDLTLDVMALRDMRAARVHAHVERAFECGSRFFYSLLPLKHADDDVRHVWEAIGRRYWLHAVPTRGPAGTKWPPPAAPDGYAHVVGWRRLRS